jgi:hypothetical protein
LTVTIPVELVDDFLAKLHYVSESLQDFELLPDERNSVRFSLLPGHENDSPVIAARIAEVAQKMCGAYRPSEAKVLVSREGSGTFEADPHPLLEAQGDLFKYGRGRYGLGPQLVGLLGFFDRQLMQAIGRFSPEPHQFPSLIGADVLERCKYLRSFPHALTLVSHLREDLEAVQNFARSARWEDGKLTYSHSDLSGIECLLAPAVCFHCFAWLQNSQQSESRTFTALGKCFRYESGNLDGLERLWDFTMRELIFVGSQDYVLAQRQRAIDETVPLLDEWGLAYEIRSATDPFFIEEYASATFQLAFDLKFEVRADLPYKQKTLAVGSFNFHQDYFGRSLNIGTSSGEAAFTGCVGFGLERLVLAFLAQHGLDRNNWPDAVAREIG